MATQQLWVTSTLGGYMTNPRLSQKIWDAAQPLMRFAQFCNIKDDALNGGGKGAIILFDKMGDIPGTHGTLVETSTMPRATFILGQGTATVAEYGVAIPFTGKLEKISEFNVDNIVHKKLRSHQAQTLDRACKAAFIDTMAKYCAVATDSYSLTTNGTCIATGASNLNSYHVKNVCDQLSKWNVPPYDNEGNYVCIASVNALRGLTDDTTWIDVFRYTKPEQRLTNEAGKIYNCRFVKENHLLSNALNTSYGEAVFFGDDAVMEIPIMPPIITYEEKDHGRDKSIAWRALTAFKSIWCDIDGKTGDSVSSTYGWYPHIIHLTSAV
ncbi:MAG TPA: N4-gp56 family major capsid protein [Sedimentisphaerales bacterium]|nr:N4-gp56 family major capsid protein [Sedimentisphaerales bacterium]